MILQIIYEGDQTQVSLPPLKPGTKYDIKVTSTLDPPKGNFIHKENLHDWGSTISITSFTTPIVIKRKYLTKFI